MDTRKSKTSNSSSPKKIILKPRRVDYPRQDRAHREEYAAEVTPLPVQARGSSGESAEYRASEDTQQSSGALGYVSLGIGIASLFIWSAIMGPLAAILGYFAYSKGQKTTGAWAIGLGIVSTLSYFVMIPFAG